MNQNQTDSTAQGRVPVRQWEGFWNEERALIVATLDPISQENGRHMIATLCVKENGIIKATRIVDKQVRNTDCALNHAQQTAVENNVECIYHCEFNDAEFLADLKARHEDNQG